MGVKASKKKIQQNSSVDGKTKVHINNDFFTQKHFWCYMLTQSASHITSVIHVLPTKTDFHVL